MFGASIKVTGKQGMSNLSMMKAIRIWETEVAPELLAEVKRRAPVSQTENGGRLRDSIYLSRRSSGQGLEARVMSSAPYAKYVERGTAAHIIEPRTALALHWSGNSGSAFARRVNHPGTRPNPFVQKAIQSLLPLMASKLRENVQKEFR